MWRAATLARVVTLAAVFLFDALVPDYDTSARHSSSSSSSSWACRAVEGAMTWDSVYYLDIAARGYAHEQNRAFFPAYPIAMRFVERATRLGGGGESEPSRCGLATSALMISNLAHVLGAATLEHLGLAVVGDAALARAAALLYAFNPASVFHGVAYTESLFALASFVGCLCVARGRRNIATAVFFVAAATRSNGVLLATHLLWDLLDRVILRAWGKSAFARKRRAIETPGSEIGVSPPAEDDSAAKGAAGKVPARFADAAAYSAAYSAAGDAMKLLASIAACVARCGVVALAPYLVDRDARKAYCGAGRRVGDRRPWCDDARTPAYAFIQSRYWNVGFLRYFERKQLPNFLLAAPMLVVASHATWQHFCGTQSKRERRDAYGLHGRNARAHFIVCGAVAFACFFFARVEVATRLLSTSPAVYWHVAHHGRGGGSRSFTHDSEDDAESFGANRERFQRAWCVYSLSYLAVGALLFPNFYPWV